MTPEQKLSLVLTKLLVLEAHAVTQQRMLEEILLRLGMPQAQIDLIPASPQQASRAAQQSLAQSIAILADAAQGLAASAGE